MRLPLNIPVKQIANSERKVFLTFDDGPSPELTPQVLQILKNNNIKATFFIVTESALKHPELVNQILQEGHAIGDHSFDHKYRHYFSSYNSTREWIVKSQAELEKLCQAKPVAFRSPAGIWTPKLARALKELQVPWVHWNIRFFDTNQTFTKSKVDKKIAKIVEGGIILLHDRQSKKRAPAFLETLSYFIEKVKENNYVFEKITILNL